jgi:hypothetical protein
MVAGGIQNALQRSGRDAINKTLMDHSGKLIEDVGCFWGHANERCLIAHDCLMSHYVCASEAHYPME